LALTDVFMVYTDVEFFAGLPHSLGLQ